ncbi:MAG: molybdenum cofactor guanylyltransferase, partial [Candidatus Tectomicrobia bacterium]|nr:molybdenum cofactor guanylyltransferase [Candidatus Tectomicrobia bacterium]
VILAGGKSRRMGRDKAFLPFGKGMLIERVIEVIQQVTDDVILITNTPEQYQRFGLPMFSDVIPEAGSLGGIYTGLVSAKTLYSLCLACDMPFVRPEFLCFLRETASEADVVIPRNAEDFQPLCAVYSQVCREPIRQRIEAGRLKITGFFDHVRVRIIEGELLTRYDPHDVMFFNANTPEEYERARQLLEKLEALST